MPTRRGSAALIVGLLAVLVLVAVAIVYLAGAGEPPVSTTPGPAGATAPAAVSRDCTYATTGAEPDGSPIVHGSCIESFDGPGVVVTERATTPPSSDDGGRGR